MLIQLHHLRLALHCDETAVNAEWAALFARHQADPERDNRPPDADLTLTVVAVPPATPPQPPYFTGPSAGSAAPLRAFQPAPGQVRLHLPDGSCVETPVGPAARPGTGPARITVTTTRPVLANGRLEDITLISLAPFLRAHAIYMVHAFAAAREGRAVLMIGQSGSGKTTTGLNLVAHGWSLLANDVALLVREPRRVVVLPSPGTVNVAAETLRLLPALAGLATGRTPHPADGKYHLPAGALPGDDPAPATPVLLYFPRLAGRGRSSLTPLPRAVGLAQLMVESVDHWDEATLDDHITLLQTLGQQTESYQIELGTDFDRLAGLIAGQLADTSPPIPDP